MQRHAGRGLDHGKAERGLGWRPAPVHDSIRRAAEFYREHRRKLKAAQSCRAAGYGSDDERFVYRALDVR